MDFEIEKSRLFGKVALCPSKSHTLRAILFASLASGTSIIHNMLDSPDTEAMIAACKVLGATIEKETVIGRGDNRRLMTASVDAQNSGIVLRFIAACAALSDQPLHITGDASIRSRRVVQPLIEGLRQLGAIASSTNGFAPITVCGPVTSGKVLIDGMDSQPVSALLIASSLLSGTTEIEVQNLGERPWLMLTVDWLKRLGVQIVCEQSRFLVTGQKSFAPFTYAVPGDLSTLGFLLVAALICESDLTIENVDLDDVQGDKIIIDILRRMGATFSIQDKAIHVKGPQELEGCDIDVNDCVDALPILAVCALFAKNKTRLYNGHICRHKESDRIQAMAKELHKMGACISELDDGLCIENSVLTGTSVSSHSDHRVALSLSVAAMQAKGKSVVHNVQCVKKSYPRFLEDMKNVGVCIR